jgi:site-specific DNA-methyltransferase (adenine-specific)
MILADLAYGTSQANFDIVIPFEPLWEQYHKVIKDNGAIVLFGQEPFSSYLRLSNIKEYKYDWIWDKVKGVGFLNAKKQPMRNHELISVFYKQQCKYNPQMTHGHKRKVSYRTDNQQGEVYGSCGENLYDSTDRYPRSIQVFSTDTQNSSLHPTQKPIKLLQFLIKTYTDEGEWVLDSCMGSGSTGVACCTTNRNFIGIELDDNYFEIAKKRIEESNTDLFDL